MAHNATDSSTLSTYINSKSPSICVVKFGNNLTCPPCKASHPIFHHAADKHKAKCNFVDVDLGKAGSLGGSYGIKSMPTFIYFSNGVESKRVVGANNLESDINAFVQQYGKTVFETSQGKSLGAAPTTTTTTTAPSSTTTSSSSTRRANNPWAQKGFNPAEAMKKNAGIDEEKNGETTEGPNGMICEGDVCYMPGSKPKSIATTTGSDKPKSVCMGCSIM